MLQVENLVKTFPLRGGKPGTAVRALTDVGFSLAAGGTLAIVGESGCGKTTLARCLCGLVKPDSGRVIWHGVPMTGLAEKELLPLRRRIQYVFQDPYSSLDPRMRVESILEEPLSIHTRLPRDERRSRVRAALEAVGLDAGAGGRFPREFSGGQRQRISLARALIQQPECLILDEPVSALDVSIQAQILNLLAELREQNGFSYLLISHDLAVVRRISTRVLVLYLGRKVEEGPVAEVFADPRHPYTRLLLDSLPGSGRKRAPGDLELPSNISPPPGCPFHTRCPLEQLPACRSVFPGYTVAGEHSVACHLAR